MTTINISQGKKVYFASDNHLGAPTMESSKAREKKFVAWLDEIKDDAGAIFLLGDLFDFWICLLYTSPSPRDRQKSRMPSSA